MRCASPAVSRTRFASFEPGQRISRLLPDTSAKPAAATSYGWVSDTAPEHGAELLAERGGECFTEAGRVVVRQRALGRLERDRDRERLAPVRDRIAAVVAEEAYVAQLRPDRRPRRGHQVARRDAFVDDEREVEAERRVRGYRRGRGPDGPRG